MLGKPKLIFSLLSMILYMLEVVKQDGNSLDKHLISLARLNNKTVSGMETVAEQCRAFNSLSDHLSVVSLNATLFYLEETRRTGTRLLPSYIPYHYCKFYFFSIP